MPPGQCTPDLYRYQLRAVDQQLTVDDALKELSTSYMKGIYRIEGCDPAICVHGRHAFSGAPADFVLLPGSPALMAPAARS
jgi:hypothetical protein